MSFARTQYVRIARYWTLKDRLFEEAEIQVIPEPDEGSTDKSLTAIQPFSRKSGNEIAGMSILDAEQLRELHEAIGKRLAELDAMAAESS